MTKERKPTTYAAVTSIYADDLLCDRGGRYSATVDDDPTPIERSYAGLWANDPPEPLIDRREDGDVTGYEIDKGPGSELPPSPEPECGGEGGEPTDGTSDRPVTKPKFIRRV